MDRSQWGITPSSLPTRCLFRSSTYALVATLLAASFGKLQIHAQPVLQATDAQIAQLPSELQSIPRLNLSIAAEAGSPAPSIKSLHIALQARVGLMKQLMRDLPAQARTFALSASTRAALAKIDPSLAILVEQDAALSGQLLVSIADDFEHKTSANHYTLHTFDQDIELSFVHPPDTRIQAPGASSTVTGLMLDNLLAVDSIQVAAPGQKACASHTTLRPATNAQAAATTVPATCSTTGAQSIAVLLVNFPNNTPAFPTGLDQSSFWNGILTGSNPSVNGYWNEASYGQTTATSSVFGPFQLSQQYDCTTTGAMATAVFAAATGTVDFTQFNRYVIVFPASTCTFGGLGLIGCAAASSTIDHQYSVVWLPILDWYAADNKNPQLWGDLTHELGHNLGLNHANSLDFGPIPLGPLDFIATNPGTVVTSPPAPTGEAEAAPPTPISAVNTEYGDPFSSMGNAWTNAGPYSAEHRADVLGWIPLTDQASVLTSSSYTLSPAEGSTGLRALRVLRDPYSSSWLWLEFHQSTGFYTPNNLAAQTGNNFTNGAVIHYEDGNLDELHTYLVDMNPVAVPNNFVTSNLEAGKSWSDPYSLLTLTIGNQTSQLPVTVSYDTPCATVSLSATELPAAGGTANVNISAPSSCSWTVASNASWISFPGTTSGSGNATVAFDYAANTGAAQLNSYITVQRQSLPVVQDGSTFTMVGISPAAGSGIAQTFTVSIADALGISDLGYLIMQFGNSNCYIEALISTTSYTSGFFWLLSDNGTFGSGIASGSGSISNSECTLNGAGSVISTSGNNLTMKLNMGFAASFAGTYDLRIIAYRGGNWIGPYPGGIFTVTSASSSQAATPVISPAGGTFTSAQTVTITEATSNATIYYTTNGTTPSTSSTKYTGPLTVSSSETLEAIATATGYSTSSTATASFTITAPPGFTIASTAVTVAPGATSSNASTITVTPSGGFTGSVALSAAVTSGPNGAVDAPGLSFGATNPVSISSTSAATATLTITTTAAATSSLRTAASSNHLWITSGSAVFACIFVFVGRVNRKKWLSLVGLTLLSLTLSSSLLACGGGGGGGNGGGSGGGSGTSNPGTTAGNYTITVTATSGSITTTATVSLVVQ